MTVTRAQTRIHRAYPGKPQTFAFTQEANKQPVFYSMLLTNGNGSSTDAALLKGYAPGAAKVLKEDSVGISDISSLLDEVQSVFEADGDALYFGGKQPFGLVGLVIDTAGVDGSPAYDLEYWNGSAWVDINAFEEFPGLLAAGYDYVIFPAPVEWRAGGQDSSAANLPNQNLFYIRMVATTANTTSSPEISDVVMAEILHHRPSLGSKASLEVSAIDPHKPYEIDSGEGIIPYFKDANALNTVEISFSYQG